MHQNSYIVSHSAHPVLIGQQALPSYLLWSNKSQVVMTRCLEVSGIGTVQYKILAILLGVEFGG